MLFYKRDKRSLTLIELIIVMVVIGILVTFAVPTFMGVQTRTKDNQAKTALKILQTAVKNFGMDRGSYSPDDDGTGGWLCNGTADCNRVLNTDISGTNWRYRVNVHYSVDPSGTFCIDADKVTDNTESWHIEEFDEIAQDCRCAVGRCTNR